MMSNTPRIGLYFILDNEDYAFRAWPAVPRIGELVMLYNNVTKKQATAIVKTVVWGTRDKPGDFCCNIEIEWEEASE